MKIKSKNFNVMAGAAVSVLAVLGAVCLGAANEILGVRQVGALGYQEDVNVQFTLNPTISVTVSGGLTIEDLVPGGSPMDSNVITVGANTNAVNGYTLSATVGTNGGTDALVNTSKNTYTFANLTGTAATLNDISGNSWGYSYSADGGTSWVSGSVGSTTTGYGALPLDGNASADERGKSGVTLIDTSDYSSGTTVQFKIGANATATQPAGEYTNTINFYAVTKAAS